MSEELPYEFSQLKPLREKSAAQYQPDDEQIEQYADYIGINLPQQKFLLSIAKQGITAQLPQQWQACSAPDGEIIYRNTKTKKIQEQHPLDQYYRQKVINQRSKLLGVAQLLSNQQEGIEEYSYQQNSLNTIPQQKSEEQSFDRSQSIDQFAQPSNQSMKILNNPLRPDNGSQLLNNGMYMFSSSGISQQYTSKDILSNNKSNIGNFESLKQKSSLLDSHKEFFNIDKKPDNKNIKDSKTQNIRTPDVSSIRYRQKLEYLSKLKQSLQNTRRVKAVKQQLLLQIKQNNGLKIEKIKKNFKAK